MSSATRSELERPRKWPCTVGLSGSDSELALVVASGGRGDGKAVPEPARPSDEPRRDPVAEPAACCEQKLMLDLRRELCRSKVFCAEKGLGRTRYLQGRTEQSRGE